jgi:DNA-binding FrmR family transcriptional regulator
LVVFPRKRKPGANAELTFDFDAFQLLRDRGVAYIRTMTHTVREKQKLLARVRRIRGQVEGIERALNGEAGCDQIMHLIAGVRGAIAGLMAEVVEDHVQAHLVDIEKYPGALNSDAAEQLLEVVRAYMK